MRRDDALSALLTVRAEFSDLRDALRTDDRLPPDRL